MNFAISIEDYWRMITSHEPFAVANYGDGEWNWILDRPITNCDGVKGSRELTDALCMTLDHGGNYLYGTTHRRGLAKPVEEFMRTRCPDLKWVDKETFANANLAGELRPFFDACMKRRILVVGPAHIMPALPRLFDRSQYFFIPIQDTNAFGFRDYIINQILELLPRVDIILFSAGPLTNVLIWMMERLAANLGISMIDMGACFDPYAGKFSRSGYRNPEKRAKMLANFLPGADIPKGF